MARGVLAFAALLVAGAELVRGDPVKGPYEVQRKRYTEVDGMDNTGRAIDVWYPVGAQGQKFPLIAYAHGLAGGGPTLPLAYMDHLNALATFGYIIAASEACSFGCSDLSTLPFDPPGFGHFYEQQLLVIDWAKQQQDDIMSAVDLDIGVGVAGHSMGGQSTLYSSSEHGAGHGIKAAVMQHAFTHTYPAPTVPFLAFTGTSDLTAAASMTRNFYNNASAYPIKGIVNKVGQSHDEPNPGFAFNPALASLTAAWFKLHLDETPQADGNDYHDLIFNRMCDGDYDGAVEECEVQDPTRSQMV